MAADSERRLRKVMDKLYHFPGTSTPSSASSSAAKRKRWEWSGAVGENLGPRLRFGLERASRIPSTAAELGAKALGPPPPCRPWDRGDLMRRLSTFKAMTWFAKPKIIGPVNCARRGWTNSEVDVISCEACGTRLLFSSPSSWPPQQVEKAAAVFSAKLDSGHKSLCPWIDNICNESLASFPPTPPEVLVENYNECMSYLMRLLALPVLSPAALEHMKARSSQIEQFLSEPSFSSFLLGKGITVSENPESAYDDVDTTDMKYYYQALKLISLCGWELRLLPYAVECAFWSAPMKRTVCSSGSSEEQPSVVSGESQLPGRVCQSSFDYDPSSVVLECRFCGACVALWNFSMVMRPRQLFNVIVDPDGQDGESNGPHTNTEAGEEVQNFSTLKFGLSIAGGPPPTRQIFRPRVSFPIVSRHWKSDLSSKKIPSEAVVVPSAEESLRCHKRKRDELCVAGTDANAAPNESTGNRALPLHKSETAKILSELINSVKESEIAVADGSAVITMDANCKSTAEKISHLNTNSRISNCPEANSNDASPWKMPLLYSKIDTFDPINQHRTFCPWIASGNGGAMQGWKLTLAALISHKSSGKNPSEDSRTILFDEEDDDPVSWVRKLFFSLPSKRVKDNLS